MLTDARSPQCENAGVFLRVRGLSKRYGVRGGGWRKRISLSAANEVSFEVATGQTLALVGSSGSGKSTVARCVARLEKPDEGEVWVNNQEITRLSQRELIPFRFEVQMIFQDAATSMNPRMTAGAAIEEPLLLQGHETREPRRVRVIELMNEVGVNPEWVGRKVTEFSGGQKQRLAIARALALRPGLLILDEAFSGLDLSTQGQIANLLLDLQAAHSLTYLMISHDLTLVSRMADTIAVMCKGQVVEQGPTAGITANPGHKETQALVAATAGSRSAFAGMLRSS